jgi:hypothetical protein
VAWHGICGGLPLPSYACLQTGIITRRQ